MSKLTNRSWIVKAIVILLFVVHSQGSLLHVNSAQFPYIKLLRRPSLSLQNKTAALIDSVQLSESFPHFVAGVVAGTIECLVGHPLDTIRVMVMTDPSHSARAILMKSLSSLSGISNLYRGVTSELVSSAVAGCVVFGFNDLLKRWIGRSLNDENLDNVDAGFVTAATAAGLLDGLSSKPLEMIRLRQQALIPQQLSVSSEPSFFHFFRKSEPRGPGFVESAKMLWDEGGLAGYFRGWKPTVIREAMGNAAYFVAYQCTKIKLHRWRHQLLSTNSTTAKKGQWSRRLGLRRKKPRSLEKLSRFVCAQAGNLMSDTAIVLAAGAVAGVAYVLASHPLETVSVLMQTDLPVWKLRAANSGRSLLSSTCFSDGANTLNSHAQLLTNAGLEATPIYRYNSMKECFSDVVSTDGALSLFRGVIPTIARSVPAIAASFLGYEWTVEALERRRKCMLQQKLHEDDRRKAVSAPLKGDRSVKQLQQEFLSSKSAFDEVNFVFPRRGFGNNFNKLQF